MNQTWWNQNLSNGKIMDQFKNWIGDYSAQSKVVMRQYIISKGYKSIADVGCGVATEYDGYKNEGYQIDYVGIDSCSILVNNNKSIGIPMIESNCEKIPLPDNSVDVAYSRHVFEHQQNLLELVERRRFMFFL